MSRLLFPCFRPVLMLAAAASLALSPCAHAYVDDAHSMTMEMATPYVEKGFKVRQDYWKGEIKSGATKSVKAQLFKGNEYWFWLGHDADKAELTLKVLDQKGQPVEVEFKKGNCAVGVRVLPPKTGSYTFVFSATLPDESKCNWALAYAYR